MTHSWEQDLHARAAQAIRAARGRRSAQWLADETAKLGHPISRDTLTNYENRRRQGLDVTDLLVLAAALRVPPVALLFGGAPDEAVEVLPGDKRSSVSALAWFIGDRELGWPGPDVVPDAARDQANATVTDPDSTSFQLLGLIRQRAGKHRELHMATRGLSQVDPERFGSALEHIGKLTENIDDINIEITSTVAEMKGETK